MRTRQFGARGIVVSGNFTAHWNCAECAGRGAPSSSATERAWNRSKAARLECLSSVNPRGYPQDAERVTLAT